MSTYKVTYYESFFADIEIEADSPEEAEEKFWEQWEDSNEFVDNVFCVREVTDSSVEVE